MAGTWVVKGYMYEYSVFREEQVKKGEEGQRGPSHPSCRS
jgi:hypothetical protein